MEAIKDMRNIDPERPPKNPGEGTVPPAPFFYSEKWKRLTTGKEINVWCPDCGSATWHTLRDGCLTCFEYSEQEKEEAK